MRILHLGWDGRRARLLDAFDKGVQHVTVPAEADACAADFPSLDGAPTPGRLQRLAKAMRGYDLILTYGWGAMDAAMAHTLFGEFHGLAPLIHHEDSDGAQTLKRTRTWYRRIALGRAARVIVPSRRLETIAREIWQLPAGKVKRIAVGVDTGAYDRTPKPDTLPRVIKRPGERWLGAVADFTAEEEFDRLVGAFAVLPEEWQLVIVGDGPEREAIRDEALRQDVAHRVHLPGPVPDFAKVAGLFDIFTLPDGGAFSAPLVEAMAAGLPVVSTDTGDVAEVVADENRPFITPRSDEDALAGALLALAEDEVLRRRTGDANRRRAKAEFDAKAMVAAYRAAYAQAFGRDTFP